MDRPTAIIVAVGLAAAAGACKPKLGDDKTNVAADFENTRYAEDIVTAKEYEEYEDQGKGVSPKTITAIDHAIRNVYERDFERCLEEEMDRQETRFMRAVYTVEFDIGTDGRVKDAKVLEIAARKQDAKGADLGPVPTDQLAKCIHDAVLTWEFDDKPEVEFKHTYRGQAGEAF